MGHLRWRACRSWRIWSLLRPDLHLWTSGLLGTIWDEFPDPVRNCAIQLSQSSYGLGMCLRELFSQLVGAASGDKSCHRLRLYIRQRGGKWPGLGFRSRIGKSHASSGVFAMVYLFGSVFHPSLDLPKGR